MKVGAQLVLEMHYSRERELRGADGRRQAAAKRRIFNAA
jgi:hypothetical protein